MESKFNFLIASERSGSNLIIKILDNHVNSCSPSPVHLLRIFEPIEGTYGDFEDDENWRVFISDVLELFNCKISVWEAQFSSDELLNCTPRNLAAVFKYIYLKEAGSQGMSKLFVKENHAYILYPFYKQYFRRCKMIWLVRDPIDMALSFRNNLIHHGGLIRASHIWNLDQSQTILLKMNSSNFDAIHFVKYEDILQESDNAAKDICSFLGIDYSSEIIDAMVQKKSSSENAKASISWSNISKGLLRDNFNMYRKALSEKEIKFIEYICYDNMKLFGYEPDYNKCNREEFIELQYEMANNEPYTKVGYKSIGKNEISKRARWMKFTGSLKPRVKKAFL